MLLQKVTNTPGEGDGHFFAFCDLNQCCLTLRNRRAQSAGIDNELWFGIWYSIIAGGISL